ncbi:hypothetical protein ACFLXU_04130 [Chloroflexota bacterium]
MSHNSVVYNHQVVTGSLVQHLTARLRLYALTIRGITINGEEPYSANIHEADTEAMTTRGDVYHKTVDIPSGLPGNLLTSQELMEHFRDDVSYGDKPSPKENIDELVSLLGQFEKVEDVRSLITLLISHD